MIEKADDLGSIVIEEERLTENYTRVPNTILRHPELSAGAKLCYAMLLSYAHYENACFPGQARLAKDIGGGVRSVARYLSELQKFRLLKVKRRGLGKTNLYTLAKWVDIRPAKMASPDLPDDKKAEMPEWPGENDSGEKTENETGGRTPLIRAADTISAKVKRRYSIDEMATWLRKLGFDEDDTELPKRVNLFAINGMSSLVEILEQLERIR